MLQPVFPARPLYHSAHPAVNICITVSGGSNAGVTWTNISGNLPDIPTWSIAVANYGSSTANDVYYVGTDEGVFASSNQGTSWSHLGLGLPNVQVQNLAISAKLGILDGGVLAHEQQGTHHRRGRQ